MDLLKVFTVGAIIGILTVGGLAAIAITGAKEEIALQGKMTIQGKEYDVIPRVIPCPPHK